MPYAAVTHAPYAPGSDTSRDAARRVKPQTQMERMRWLYLYMEGCGGFTDHEMHEVTGYPINVITARRNAIGCKPVGKRMGPHGVVVTAWEMEGGRSDRG